MGIAATERDSQILAQVERGAALFDEKYPGWADEIDVKKLDQFFLDRNIIHLVMPEIMYYARELGLSEHYGCIQCGFYIPPENYSDEEFFELKKLQTRAWMLVILRRQFSIQV